MKNKWMKAFSLPLIVSVIVGVGYLYLQPAVNAARDRARTVDCAGNLRQLGLALHQYSGDNREAFPESLQEIESYAARQTQLLVCSSSDPQQISVAADFSRIGPTNVSYYYVAGGSLGSRLPNQAQMFCLPGTHQGEGGRILFTGGHVKWLSVESSEDETFWDVLRRSGITPEMVAAATNKVIYLDDEEVDL